MSGEVLQNAVGEMTVEARPVEEDARAALEAARSELETLRSEVERFRAGEQARMAADEEARRRAEVERRFKAAAGDREFLHEYVRKGLLADFAAALEDAANAGKSDAEVFSALTREKNCFAAQNPPCLLYTSRCV